MSELSFCEACQGTLCDLHGVTSVGAVVWTGAHTWAHPDTHRNVWMFFPGSKCGFYIPHSSLAFCVLGDLPKIQCQPILTELWSQHCRCYSKTKHTQAHMNAHSYALNQVNCGSKAFMLCNSYSSPLLLISERGSRKWLAEKGEVAGLELAFWHC